MGQSGDWLRIPQTTRNACRPRFAEKCFSLGGEVGLFAGVENAL